MENKTKTLAPMIFLVVIFSGCVSSFLNESGGYGIVIEQFLAEPDHLESEEPFDIKLVIRNTGSTKALDVHPTLYNINIDAPGFGKDSDINCIPSWDTGFDLLGKDTENEITGESKTCVWRCLAPPLEKGLSVNYNPSVRIYYVYAANTIKSVTIASQDELKEIQSQGRALPNEIVGSIEGPIKIDIKVKGPVKSWTGKNYLTFPVEIVVQNIGGGTVCSPMSIGVEGCKTPQYWNKIILFSRSIDIQFTDCDLEMGQMATVDLFGGSESKMTCEATMLVPMDIRGIIQKNIEITANYVYFIDQTTSVYVEGTKEYELLTPTPTF